MDKNRHAIIIGINEYTDSRNFPALRFAEKDANDIHETLNEFGDFSPENTKLIYGEAATTHALESIMFTEIVKRRNSTDTVLVYFSGHGFLAGEFGKAYLGTWDSSIEEILSNPNAGLRMDYIHDEIFMRSQAERIILVLDCCHSGAFIPPTSTHTKDLASGDLIAPSFFSKASGRVAIVSSPRGVPSRESAQLKNGIFTHFLIQGLKGAAAEENGEVTIDSAMAYIRRKVPTDQPTGRYGHDIGRFVITKTQAPPERNLLQLDEIGHRVDLELKSPVIQLASNPLDFCSAIIADLALKLSGLVAEADTEVATFILDVVRNIYRAESTFVLRIEDHKISVRFRSHTTPNFNLTNIAQVSAFVGKHAQKEKSFLGHHGILHNYREIPYKDGKASDTNLFIIFLREDPLELMVIAGIAPDSSLTSDVCAVIMKSLYYASSEMTSLNVKYVEERIIDDLKVIYSFVPLDVYDRRFSLFTERLSRVLIEFQPVLYLDSQFLHISSWEALARDQELANQAPSALFKAAEMWGSQFTIELDKRVISLAPTLYRKALSRSGELKRVEDIRELSVNVYPQSLMRSAYHQALAEVMKEKVIPPEKLILEISEKVPIPGESQADHEGAMGKFREQLSKYVEEFQIGFAIDDFGIGYASISRLLGLSLSYVKIDRSILSSEQSELTLSYVLTLIKANNLQASKIVVEGYDEEIQKRVALNDLYKIGVRYVQGYLVGKAGPELYRLDKSLESQIRKLLTQST